MDKQLHSLISVRWNYLSISKLQRCNRWSLGMDKQFHPTLYWKCEHLIMLGLKSTHVDKRGPRYAIFIYYHMYSNYVWLISIRYWIQDWLYLSYNFVSQPWSFIAIVSRGLSGTTVQRVRVPSVLVSFTSIPHSNFKLMIICNKLLFT